MFELSSPRPQNLSPRFAVARPGAPAPQRWLAPVSLALSLLLPGFASAASIYVSPTGNDSAAGTFAAPFRTIRQALSVAMPGDSVELRAGTYREIISPIRSGTAGSPITIESYSGEQAVISAFDAVPGPWTAQGNGIYATTVTGSRPFGFWTNPSSTANGTGMTVSAGLLNINVVNESGQTSTSMRSQAASSAWNFFANAVTWKVRGITAASTGATAMPEANMNLYFSIMSGAGNGYASDDAVNVFYRGDGRLVLNLKKNTPNSWGTAAQSVIDPTVNGFDLTLGPVSGGNVPYTFTAKRTSGADVVLTGSWSIAQSDWSDGGTGSTSYLSIFAQENITATTDLTQKFTINLDSYTIANGSNVVLLDEFDNGDPASVDQFPSAFSSSLSSGYDQVFVDGAMQDEARTPNRGATPYLQQTTASVTVTNASAATNPNTISSATFGGQANNFYAGARFVGGVGSKWSWQNAVVTASAGNLLTVDPTTKSTWWWPDQDNTTSETGTGFIYGLLSLLDADGEWFLNQSSSTLSLRITSGADPTSHLVEIKRRNWCIAAAGVNYITFNGLKTIGGAIQLNGSGLVLQNSDASYLSHFLVWSSGGAVDGGRAEGGGIVINGAGNTISNCTIHDTAGSGINASGNGHYITRNLFYNTDYSGTYSAPLALSGSNIVTTFNTIHDTGRDGIRPTGGGLTVMFNDISYVGRMAHDLGCIYTFGTDAYAASGARTRIGYNWVHDRGDSTDPLSKGIYLDNGCRNYLVDHNVCWNAASDSTHGAFIVNSPSFGHELYHNTIVGAGGYNVSTFTTYPNTTTYSGYTYTDSTNGLDFTGENNIVAPDASATLAFNNYAGQDFTPTTTYNFTDKRYASPIATVNPPATTGSVLWTKAAGNTTLTNPYILISMVVPSSPFFYHEAYGHGQVITGINAWVPDGQPDSGAYERGVARWIPGTAGWEGMSADPLVNLGARTAVLQVVRISIDSSPADVRLYYGATDGGTNPAAWDSFTDLGTAAPTDVISVFRPALASLTPGATYQSRFFASNAIGSTWSSVQSFSTAASLTWDAGGGASTGLSTNTNWGSDATPDLAHGGEIATFGTAGSTATIDANISLLGLVINRDANFTIADGGGSLALGGSGITVTLPATTGRTHTISVSNLGLTADQTWSVTNNTGAAALNVSSNISGAHSITKTGTGSLTLSGNSTFDGAVNVSVGPVTISNGNALGSANGATTIAATGSAATGGQVLLSGGITTAENFVITGTTEAGSFVRAIDNSSGTNTITGSITLVGSGSVRLGPSTGVLNLTGTIARNGTDVGTLLLGPSAGATLNIAAPINLNGAQLNLINPGVTVLLAASVNIGNTTVYFGSPAVNGPTLKLGVDNALPTNRTLTLGTTGASNGADRGTLDLAGFQQTVNGLIGSAGTGTSPSPATTRLVTNSAAGTLSTLTVGNGNASSTFNGLIQDGSGQVALVKTGTGTLTLPTANTYTGSTTVNGGTLSLGAASLASGAAVNLSTGVTLNLNFSGTNTIGALTINGLGQAPGTWGSLTSSATNKTALITGAGLLNVTGAQSAYDAWALAAGLDNSTAAKDASLTGDPAHDGVSNLLKYALHMNPTAGGSVPESIINNSSSLDFIFTKNKAATDVTYIVEWSNTLNSADWSTSGLSAPTVLSDNGVTQQVKVTAPAGSGANQCFIRLRVTKP